MGSSKKVQHDRTICLPFKRDHYLNIVDDPKEFREYIVQRIIDFPDLFPNEILFGFKMKDIYISKKLDIPIRRIELIGNVSYTIRPSFVMPNLTGYVEDCKHALFLRKFSVPFWGLSMVFGRNPMYWYRMEQSLGRLNLVGTATYSPDATIPEHLLADEKHSRIKGEKTYIGTTCASGMILGASVSAKADEQHLTKAYGVFKEEAQYIDPSYRPKTVNTDGWLATKSSWLNLFPLITIIACFLHVYISIRDRAKIRHSEMFREVSDRLWNCFHATGIASFSQRVRRFREWADRIEIVDVIEAKLDKFFYEIKQFKLAYQYPGAYRTSNMLDRLMRRMDCHLMNTQYFHGGFEAAELSIRGWAMIQNFAPSDQMTITKHNGWQSPAERFNKARFSDCWLENLLIASSQKGKFCQPQDP